VSVVIEAASTSLAPEAGGFFGGVVDGVGPGARYAFRLDDDAKLYPDPASRFQPDGPHGPSEVVDAHAFVWKSPWNGAGATGQVVYEMHIGTFTSEGTWSSAIERLPHLAALGVTLLEVLPVNEFPGRFGWGYDGVDLFAPTRLYGRPDDFRRFVDAAHGLGLGVILDVVYNHLGPDGNYLKAFSPAYFSAKYATDWGEAINFDGEGSAPVRDFFASNAEHWVAEYRLDGLRFDATQCIFDDSPIHVLAEIASRARAAAAPRPLFLVAENEEQKTIVVRSPSAAGAGRGYGLDALWNDDFHHTAYVALTGKAEAYCTDYNGSPQELVSATRWGYLFQGQRYKWQKKRRGTPALDLPATAFVSYLQNHDQVANSGTGARLDAMTSPAKLRAMVALMLLSPATPMLFQGEEFASSSPFLFFADHEAALAALVRKGRRQFLSQFPSYATQEVADALDDPGSPATFERCKLDWREVQSHTQVLRLYTDLLALRRNDPVLASQRADRVHGAVLSSEAFLLRFFGDDSQSDRLLVVNLGKDLELDPAPEPLLAPPLGGSWRLLWSSESPGYGGTGTPPIEDEANWKIPARAAVVMTGEVAAAEDGGA
jgi:maltooligosyltrehalose trehalohydrolase